MSGNDLSLLNGMTIKEISVHSSNEEVWIDCEDKQSFRMYHTQDCCEHVRIHHIDGDETQFKGEKIAAATEEVLYRRHPEDFDDDAKFEAERDESWTWTIFRILTESGKLLKISWLGTSNGYYSESVHFTRTTPAML